MKITVHLSRHALERYIERTHGVDVAAITRRIIYAAQAAHNAGASSVTIDGLRFPITKDGTIVTALRSEALRRIQQKEIKHDTRSDHRHKRSAGNGRLGLRDKRTSARRDRIPDDEA